MTNVHLKMIAKKYYFCFFILLCVGGSYEQCQNGLPNYVPSDYKYVKSMENFYKVHTKVAAWQEAKLKCEEEEAMLFYPRSTAEYHAVSSYVIEAEDAFPYNNTDAYGIWIGVSSLNTDKFLTLDGFPMEAVFDRWGENEPNGGSDEECLALKQGGYLSDWPCQAKKPFMCKKTLGSVLLKMTCSETSSTKTVQDIQSEKYYEGNSI